jgi:hypothetical protein
VHGAVARRTLGNGREIGKVERKPDNQQVMVLRAVKASKQSIVRDVGRNGREREGEGGRRREGGKEGREKRRGKERGKEREGNK